MDYQIARSIQKFNEAAWDALAGDEITMTHRWQRVMEASRPDYNVRYLLATSNQVPLIAVTLSATTQAKILGRLKRPLQRLFFMVRAPCSLGHCGIGLQPGAALADVLPQLQQALEGLCKQERRPLLTIGNVPAADVSAWQSHGFFATRFAASAELDLPASYEQYLQALSSKQRSELRRMRRQAAKLDVSFAQGALDGDGRQLYPLLCRVYEQHGVATPFKPNLFEALEHEMANNVFVFKGFVAGKLAGVFVCLKEKQKLWWWGVGLDYELARPTYVYFLLLDELIRWSVKHKVQHIYGGATNEREKQKQGFCLQKRWLCHRATPHWLNRTLGLTLPVLQCLSERRTAH